MYKVMIVEDDAGIAQGIVQALSPWGYQCIAVQDFEKVDDCFYGNQPHIVLMDIHLPFYDGYHWCEIIRRQSKVPILFLSSSSDNMNIVMAINMGADDFLAKPFDSTVLIAKISALLRRSYDFVSEVPTLSHRDAFLNQNENCLLYKDQKIDLTKNEYRILYALFSHKGSVVSREKLMEILWESGEFVDENTLNVNVNRLRRKLETAGLNDFIATKFKVGYYLS